MRSSIFNHLQLTLKRTLAFSKGGKVKMKAGYFFRRIYGRKMNKESEEEEVTPGVRRRFIDERIKVI